MKIKNTVNRKSKLIHLNILKSKWHKKFHLTKLNHETKQTEFCLKKAAQVIYHYHAYGKRILFLGFPLSFNNLLKNTKHILIPESNWLNGIITNQILRFSYNLTKQQKQLSFKIVWLLLQLKKKIDLIVTFNLNTSFNAIEEGYAARIPIIAGSSDLDIRNEKITYKILSDLKLTNDKLLNSNFFISMVKMVLKKSTLLSYKKFQIIYYKYIKHKFKKKYRTFRQKKQYSKSHGTRKKS